MYQGDMISPLLFNFFLNDIEKECHNPECVPLTLIDKDVGCLLYADDLAIISPSLTGRLQNGLNQNGC